MRKPSKKAYQTKIYYKNNNKNNTKRNGNIRETIEKRYHVLIFAIFVIALILTGNLFAIQIVNHDYYVGRVNELTQNVVYSDSAPRGRIYDRNHRLIVNNEPVKVISYKKENDVTTKKEIEMAYLLSDMITLDTSKLKIRSLKEFWLKLNPDLGKAKITEEEWKKLEERKLSSDDIEEMKMERITEEELATLEEKDKEAAYIYYLMNMGYSYAEKSIKKENVTDQEYALVSENLGSLPGFDTKLDWNRVFPYGDVFETMLGSVSTSENGIPYELKEYYLSKGYALNDRVGTSYLEYQYEDLLKGTKTKYELLNDGTYKLLEEGKRGNDIVLTIDIELQKAVEQILTEQLIATKQEPNTEYYNRSFVVITDPNTGEILAMAGKQIVLENGIPKIYDYTPGITTSPVVVGSVVKGASHIVGYNTGALQIGEKRLDQCIKIASTPLKCSWTSLGWVDDISALKQSSNTYQFFTAMKVGNGNYVYDKPLELNPKAFDTYRTTFQEFGLGVKTGIDLPVESLGYQGNNTLPGYLLDFSIGQYDTYTPIQLSQYIGTIANGGKRMQPYLLKSVYAPSKDGLQELIKENQPTVLNTVTTESKYFDRVKQGFREVITGGTGYGYIDAVYQAAGKTGTSQSFVDSNQDGTIDTETLTNTFVAYAPYDKPTVAFTVISPDISHYGNKSTYQTIVNKRITNQISKKYFEIYQ